MGTALAVAAWAASPPAFRPMRPNRRYSDGTTNRFNSVEVIIPPRFTTAIGYSISCPEYRRPRRAARVPPGCERCHQNW